MWDGYGARHLMHIMQKTSFKFRRKPKTHTTSLPSDGKATTPGRPQRKKQLKGVSIPHHRFIQAAQPAAPITEIQAATAMFSTLNLHNRLAENIIAKGYVHMTPVQEQGIPSIMAGRDLMAIAQTGTGKTAAFLIPLIHRWLSDPQARPALVLTPTRELALQIHDEFRSLAVGLGLFSNPFIGGANMNTDIRRLAKFHHLVVATPGRLLDLVGRRALDLANFNTLILDEFDRMLDMGFVHDVNRITKAMKYRNQTLMFSATLVPEVQEHIDRLLTEPVTVQVSTGVTSADHIEQDIVKVGQQEDRFDVLTNLLSGPEIKKAIIFAETKHKVNRLAIKLAKRGFRADAIHGDKSQGQRQRALDKFREDRINILVATDVAARGLDIPAVSHVINYEAPKQWDTYIHRIGRTGRAGQEGKAITFVND